jgi:hypothetical protein
MECFRGYVNPKYKDAGLFDLAQNFESYIAYYFGFFFQVGKDITLSSIEMINQSLFINCYPITPGINNNLAPKHVWVLFIFLFYKNI